MRFSISIVCAPYTEANISKSAQFDYYRLLAKQSEAKKSYDLSRNGWDFKDWSILVATNKRELSVIYDTRWKSFV